MSCLKASHAVYVEDVQRVTGNFFDHDDSINDRTQGSQLNHGFQATCDLWRQNFGTVRSCLLYILRVNEPA